MPTLNPVLKNTTQFGDTTMKMTTGNTLFELTSAEETLCYDALKAYFEAMYFAN